MKDIKGAIIVNHFYRPKESIKQAERFVKEFEKLGVKTEIMSDGFLNNYITSGNIKSQFIDYDFVLYLDKDKYLSQMIENSGVRLFNSSRAIEVCNDKAQTYIALSGKGFNLLKTVFAPLCYMKEDCLSEKEIDNIIETLKLPVIVKECFGSKGLTVYKADSKERLTEIINKLKDKPHLYQEYLGKEKGVDIRVIVIGGKAVSAMKRQNDSDFRSNIAQGGKGIKIDLPEKYKRTAEDVAKTLELDYCGVDILVGDNDEPFICEVNSNAFFDGIEKATGENIAKLYAEYIIDKVNKGI